MDNYKDAIVRYAEQKQIDKHTYIKSRLNHASNFFAIPITEELLKTYESVSLMDILFIIQCEKITIEEFYAFLLPEDYRPDCSDTDYHYDYRVNGVRLPRRKPIIQLKDFGNNFAAPPVIDKKSLKPIPEPKYRKHFGELILPYHDPTVPGAKTDHRISNNDVATYGHFSADNYEKMRSASNWNRQISRSYLYPVCMYFHMSTAEAVGFFERCQNIEPLDINNPKWGLIDMVFVAFLDANCYDYEEFVKATIAQFSKYSKQLPSTLRKSPFWQEVIATVKSSLP